MTNEEFIQHIVKLRPKIISYFIKKYSLSFEDSEQHYTEAFIKLVKAMEDSSKKFIVPYFYTLIHNACKQEHNAKKTQYKKDDAVQIFYDTSVTNTTTDVDIIYNNITLRNLFDDVIDYLLTRYTLKQVNIFRAKFKSNDNQKTIAKNFGKSDTVISNLLAKMLRDVRQQFKQGLIDEYGD